MASRSTRALRDKLTLLSIIKLRKAGVHFSFVSSSAGFWLVGIQNTSVNFLTS